MARRSSSLTLTMREGDEIRVTLDSGEEVTFYLSRLSATRASVNVRAPRSAPIDRSPAKGAATTP